MIGNLAHTAHGPLSSNFSSRSILEIKLPRTSYSLHAALGSLINPCDSKSATVLHGTWKMTWSASMPHLQHRRSFVIRLELSSMNRSPRLACQRIAVA